MAYGEYFRSNPFNYTKDLNQNRIWNTYNASYVVSGVSLLNVDSSGCLTSIPTYPLTEIEKLRKELEDWTSKIFDECKL